MKTISITSKQGNLIALVDDEDYNHANRYWRMKGGYPSTHVYAGKEHGHSKHKEVMMHRFILGDSIPIGMEVDHINRNRLDNRKCNLRIVTGAQNHQNLPAQQRNRTGLRGVNWDKTHSLFKANARLNGILYSLGYFSDPVEAAAVVSDWRAKHMTHTIEGG